MSVPSEREPIPVCGYLSMSESKTEITSCSQGSKDYGMICVKSKYGMPLVTNTVFAFLSNQNAGWIFQSIVCRLCRMYFSGQYLLQGRIKLLSSVLWYQRLVQSERNVPEKGWGISHCKKQREYYEDG